MSLRIREVEDAREAARQRKRADVARRQPQRRARQRAELASRTPDQIVRDRIRLLPAGTAVCRGCGQDKPFYVFADAPAKPTGLHPFCQACDNREPRS